MRQPLFITNKFDRCLQIFLFLSPILWLPGISQNSLQFLLLDYGALILFCLAVMWNHNRITRNPSMLVILVTAILVSLMVNPKAYPVGMIHLTAGILLYYAIVLGVKNSRAIIWSLVIMCGVNVIISMCQKFGFHLVYDNNAMNAQIVEMAGREVNLMSTYIDHLSMPGMMGRNYHLTFILIIVAPLCFILNKKLGIVAMLIALAYVLMMRSYICKFAYFCSVLVVLSEYFKPKYLIIFALSVVLIIGIAKNHEIKGKIAVRRDTYKYILDDVLVNVFKGSGLSTFDINTRIYDEDSPFQSSYNQYLRIMYEMGLVEFVIMAGTVFFYFKRFAKKNRYFLASIIAMLIYPMFHEVLKYARFDIVIIAIIALFEIDCINKEKQTGKENNYGFQEDCG